ncbi:MAG TPA: hypothetical protein VKM55_01350 [Candidatus Lokiarchaeia archaeon]|nr:hypothetical protein [Candidatus Lokiarchaeia archaeon]
MSSPAKINEDQGSSNTDPGYDTSKYVSKDEFLRDIAALRYKEIKIAIFVAIGMAVGSFNIWLIRFKQIDTTLDWIFAESNGAFFDMTQIMTWLLALFILLIPGIWISVANHRFYGLAYFSGFSAAGFVFMFFPEYLIEGIYVFAMAFCLLAVVIMIYRIWKRFKESVVKPQVPISS